MKGAPKIAIIDWFAVFLLLFSGLLAVQWFVPALIVLAIFSSIFAWYYHTYLDVPPDEQQKLILSNWYARLEQRWRDQPPTVQDAEYYVKHAPMMPAVALVFLFLVSLLLVCFFGVWLRMSLG